MVQFLSSVLSVLALTPLIGASPVASSSYSEEFSIESWVNEIIADPTGDHLSPSEAWERYNASRSSTTNSLDKRATCWDEAVHKHAYAPDAVWCIDYLARKGNTACVVGTVVQFCGHGGAFIVGVRGGSSPEERDTCQNIARSCGKIMDTCFRADNTVNGYEYAWANNRIAVHLTGDPA